jgi:hypothetical protein
MWVARRPPRREPQPRFSRGGYAEVPLVPWLHPHSSTHTAPPARATPGLCTDLGWSAQSAQLCPVYPASAQSMLHSRPTSGRVQVGHADGLRRRELRLQERVGYPVAESQQADSGQSDRQGAAPPDGVR